MLNETNSLVPQVAAVELGNMRLAPDLVVPALINKLGKIKGSQGQSAFVYALGEYGAKARSAVPMLLTLLNDPDVFVRETASNALQNIAPEELKRATQK